MSLDHLLKKNWFGYLLGLYVPEDHTVLDLGVGLSAQAQYLPNKRTGVDIHKPYLDRSKNLDKKVVWDLNKFPLPFKDNSFDTVLLIGVIEHLKEDNAYDLLREIERIASKQVIVYTTDGYFEQKDDAYGLGGETYQTHRSGFYGFYYKMIGYDVVKIKCKFPKNHKIILCVKGVNNFKPYRLKLLTLLRPYYLGGGVIFMLYPFYLLPYWFAGGVRRLFKVLVKN